MCLRSLSVKLEGVSAFSGMAWQEVEGLEWRRRRLLMKAKLVTYREQCMSPVVNPHPGPAKKRALLEATHTSQHTTCDCHMLPLPSLPTSTVWKRAPLSISSNTLSPSSPLRASFSTYVWREEGAQQRSWGLTQPTEAKPPMAGQAKDSSPFHSA